MQAGDVNLDGTTVSLGSLGDYDDPADPAANLNFTLVDATGAGTVISGLNGAASLDSASLVVGTGNVSKTQDPLLPTSG